MYVFSLSLSFVVALLRGTSKVTMNTQKRSNRMEHCIEVKWVSATYRCSSTAMSAAPVGRMQSKNQRGQSWANWQDQMESKNSRVKNPELVLKCFEKVLYPRTSTWMLKECPTPCYQPPFQWWLWWFHHPLDIGARLFGDCHDFLQFHSCSKHHVKSGNQQQISEGSAQSTALWFISNIISIYKYT